MNEIIETINIEKLIYEIRGKQVMLDKDLARLYQCANGTKSLNLAVKRHMNRFPKRYMFQLTKEEWNSLRFQNETTNYNMNRTLPYVFTEQGVAMLSAILKTKVAEEISIGIMDAFVAMRKYIGNNLLEQKYINNQVMKNTEDIHLLQESFSKFEEKRKVNEIYFNGQVFDSYSKIIDIFKSTKQELIIIDGYADKIVLDMIKELNVKVILIVKPKEKLNELDIKKYQEQYNNLQVVFDNSFHDRYFIIDQNTIYHCGASINHAGSKTFSINILEEEIIKELLIEKIKSFIKIENNVIK